VFLIGEASSFDRQMQTVGLPWIRRGLAPFAGALFGV
jgi:hypothetical protein